MKSADASVMGLGSLPAGLWQELERAGDPVAGPLGESGNSPGKTPAGGAKTTVQGRARMTEVARIAYARGLARGRAEGRIAAEKEMFRRIEDAIHEFSQRWQAFLEDYEAQQNLLEQAASGFALVVAEHILADRLREEPASLLPMFRRAVEHFHQAYEIVFRCHPTVAETMRAKLSEEPILARLEFRGDPRMQPGDLILETPGARYDLRIRSQLERIAEKLAEAGFLDKDFRFPAGTEPASGEAGS